MVTACGSSQTAQSARQGAGSGAAMGALAGLVFGGDIDDVIEGAAVGGAMGAGAGAISGNARQSQAQQDAYAVNQAQQQQAQAQSRAQQAEQQLASQQYQRQLSEQQTIDMLGTDTWEGYKALRACQNQRALGLTQAGRAAENPNHRLAAEWLLAIIAVDNRDTSTAAQQKQKLVQVDQDIDTAQQASLEIDKMVLELREERRQMGIRC